MSRVNRGDWLREGKVRILLQYGTERLADLPDVPTAIELAPTEADRALFRLYAVKFNMARPLVLPPEVPAERIAALRAAFDATMKDPQYIEEAKRIGLDVNPLGGEAIARLIEQVQATPQDAVDRLHEVLARPESTALGKLRRQLDLEPLALPGADEGVFKLGNSGAHRFCKRRAQMIELFLVVQQEGGALHLVPGAAAVGQSVGQPLDDDGELLVERRVRHVGDAGEEQQPAPVHPPQHDGGRVVFLEHLLVGEGGGNIARRSTAIRALPPMRSGQMWLELTERALPDRITARSWTPAYQPSMSRTNIRVRAM